MYKKLNKLGESSNILLFSLNKFLKNRYTKSLEQFIFPTLNFHNANVSNFGKKELSYMLNYNGKYFKALENNDIELNANGISSNRQ